MRYAVGVSLRSSAVPVKRLGDTDTFATTLDKAMSLTSRPTRNVTQTRDDLLAAGAHLLATDPSHAFGVLRASHGSRQAGRTTGAFFNIWPTQEAYLEDLVDYVLSPERGTTGAAVGMVVADALRIGADEDA